MLESPELLERIDLLAERALDGAEAQGFAVGVSDRNGNRLVRTYGFANRDAGLPVEQETLFEIGSISKSALAIVCMQLVAEGRLDLHAPVTDYLPWFTVQSDFEPITPHHLLTHTSGLPSGHTHRPHGLHEVWELRNVRTIAAPGTVWTYSNVAYDALGLVVETILGQPFDQLMRERVLEPAGLDGSYATITSEMRPKLAVGYQWRLDDRPPLPRYGVVPATWLETAVGSGCIAMTASGLLAYAELLRDVWRGADSPVLTQAQLRTMLDLDAMPEAARVANYAYGLDFEIDPETPGKLRSFGHGGGMVGYTTNLLVDLENDLCVVKLASGQTASAEITAEIQNAVASLRAGEPMPELSPVRDRFALDAVAEIAGVWQSGERAIEIVAEGSGLILHSGEARVPLQWLSPASDGWLMADHPNWVLFALELVRADSEVGEEAPGPVIAIHHGGETFRRPDAEVVAIPEVPAEWAVYVGHYRSYNPWDTSKRIVLREGQLYLLESGTHVTPLVPEGDGFRVGASWPNADWLTFDAIVDGQAFILRFETGAEYSRFFMP